MLEVYGCGERGHGSTEFCVHGSGGKVAKSAVATPGGKTFEIKL